MLAAPARRIAAARRGEDAEWFPRERSELQADSSLLAGLVRWQGELARGAVFKV
ncbi:hypothetical protein [Streptomyces sp. SID12488]|uniref:hypothetical protein n=1 Tax=Streptomyces sp. SID12488 TaxID=2706040 RepID=UPI0013D9CC46|nr:hypothetical protein [Streptomyces sp. SID12488]NEA64015.1 hypothetical protein [Streptomyces sp. SID12488]